MTMFMLYHSIFILLAFSYKICDVSIILQKLGQKEESSYRKIRLQSQRLPLLNFYVTFQWIIISYKFHVRHVSPLLTFILFA